VECRWSVGGVLVEVGGGRWRSVEVGGSRKLHAHRLSTDFPKLLPDTSTDNYFQIDSCSVCTTPNYKTFHIYHIGLVSKLSSISYRCLGNWFSADFKDTGYYIIIIIIILHKGGVWGV
jgi:hypothetical protein